MTTADALFDPLESLPDPPTVEEITQIFHDFDGSGSGLLAPRQALAACGAIKNLGFSQSELENYVKEGMQVAGDGSGRIKMAPFASYLAFEAAKKHKKATTSATQSQSQSPPNNYSNPFMDIFGDANANNNNNNNDGSTGSLKVAVTSADQNGMQKQQLMNYASNTSVASNASTNSMKAGYSPTVATEIPDWFGHSIVSIEAGNFKTGGNDPFGDAFDAFGFEPQTKPGHAKSHSLTIPNFDSGNNISRQLPTFKPAASAKPAWVNTKGASHMQFPTQDILFDEDEPSNPLNANSNSNTSSGGVSNQRNISPKRAALRKKNSQGLIPGPRAKGDRVPKEKHHPKGSGHVSRSTPVADFTFADNFTSIAEQAQRAIEEDNARGDGIPEDDSDSDSGGGTPLPAAKETATSEEAPKKAKPKAKAKPKTAAPKPKKKRPKIDAIVQMKKGSAMLKYGRRGFPHFRRFQITDDLTKLIWFSRKKSLNDTHVKVRDMRDILTGQQTDVFKQCTQRTLEKASFSIVYGSKLKTLDVVAKSAEEGQLWVKGLKGLIKANKQGKLHKVIQILVDVNFKDITKTNYRNCTDEQRRKNEAKYQSRPELVHTIGSTLEQSEKIFQNLTKAAQHQNVRNSIEWENISVMIREIEDRLQEIGFGLNHKTAELADLKRDVWVLKVDVTVMEEKVKVLSKIKKRKPI